MYGMKFCIACLTLISFGEYEVAEGWPCPSCNGVCDERNGECKDPYHDQVAL